MKHYIPGTLRALGGLRRRKPPSDVISHVSGCNSKISCHAPQKPWYRMTPASGKPENRNPKIPVPGFPLKIKSLLIHDTVYAGKSLVPASKFVEALQSCVAKQSAMRHLRAS